MCQIHTFRHILFFTYTSIFPVIKVDCVWGAWGAYTSCSKSCGSGIRGRSRVIATNASGGGAACTGPYLKLEDCNTFTCGNNNNNNNNNNISKEQFLIHCVLKTYLCFSHKCKQQPLCQMERIRNQVIAIQMILPDIVLTTVKIIRTETTEC